MAVQDRVHDLLEPIVATLDVELVDVTFNGGTLRVTVDGADGISTEALAAVNRLISPILDQHDPVPGRYTLEVSSPGLERPLKKVAHYERALGEEIVVKMASGVEPRRLRGRLAEITPGPQAEQTRLSMDATEIDGVKLDEPNRREFSLQDVATARTSFDWGPGPKPGQPGAKRAKQHPKAAEGKNASKPAQKSPKGSKKKSAKKQPENSSLNREVRDEQ